MNACRTPVPMTEAGIYLQCFINQNLEQAGLQRNVYLLIDFFRPGQVRNKNTVQQFVNGGFVGCAEIQLFVYLQAQLIEIRAADTRPAIDHGCFDMTHAGEQVHANAVFQHLVDSHLVAGIQCAMVAGFGPK